MVQALGLGMMHPVVKDSFWRFYCRPKDDVKVSNQFGAYTPCFIETAMVGLAQIVAVLLCIRRWTLLKKTDGVREPKQWLEGLNLLAAFVLTVLPLGRLVTQIIAYMNGEDLLPPYELTSMVLSIITYGLIATTLWREQTTASKKGWWYIRFAVLFILMSSFGTFSYDLLFIEDYRGKVYVIFLVLFIVEKAFLVILGVMGILYYPPTVSEPLAAVEQEYSALEPVEGQTGYDQECPEFHSSWWSQLVFAWVNPIMKVGGTRPLHDWDLWHLHPSDTSAHSTAVFYKALDAERARADPSLLRALFKAFGGRFILAGFFLLVTVYTQFVPAMYLGQLLTSMILGNPISVSYRYAATILVGTIIGSVCTAHYTYNVQRVGFRMRAALIAALFRKGLHLSYAGRQGYSSGRLVGMISGQTAMFQFLVESIHNLWSTPITLVFGMYLLYNLLGHAMWAALAVALIFIPIQMWVASTIPAMSGAGMGKSGQRVGLVTEMFSHMDTVKCYGWEASFRKHIYAIRADELGWSRITLLLNAANFFTLETGPILVAVAAFAAYTFMGKPLISPQLFTSVALFAAIKIPLSFFPELVLNSYGALGAIRGLQDCLLAEEADLAPYPPIEDDKPAIEVGGTDFSWDPSSDTPTLQNISFKVMPGQLVAVVGATGQGKSSLVNAILGEMPKVGDGPTPVVRGKVAYVPQESWLFHDTVRNNILFGLPFDKVRYERALRVSSMERDMSILPKGDLTEIYERGANLSGGQKQRLSIARAVYSQAEVYFFDDPLSALDANVTKAIFETCIKKTLSGRTRLLVTNQLQYLPVCDHVILLDGGKIEDQGTFPQLMEKNPNFRELVSSAGAADEEEKQKALQDEEVKAVKALTANQKWKRALQATNAGKMWKTLQKPPQRKEEEPPEKPHVPVEEEERGTGAISGAVVKRYIRAMGGVWALLLVLLSFFVVEVLRIMGSLWMTAWSGSDGTHTGYYYIAGYAILSFAQILVTMLAILWLVFSAIFAARKLHEAMMDSVLGAPMSFFQANPLGRLINRFSKDVMTVDKMFASIMTVFLSTAFLVLSSFAFVGYENTMSLFPLTPLVLLFTAIYLYFQRTMREQERLDALTWNPVFAQWSEALGGLSTLRPYRGHERMERINGEAMDRNTRYTLLSISTHRWLQLRLDLIGSLMVFAIAGFIIMDTAGDQASKAPQLGVVLIYGFMITALLPMTFKFASLSENMFNAVERMITYVDCPHEPPAIIRDTRPPEGWPKEGAIVFDRCTMRYRPDLPPALNNLTCDVGGGQKVGVVGRTGAGKSTLFNALFRLTELEAGRVVIDGCDISLFGVADVRKALMIIPQNPVVFTGSIRFNLDPFKQFEDHDLWDALDRAHLKEIVQHLPLGLSAELADGGHNFSVGQRQLLSLGRALLRRAQILVLDEATAALDRGTDALLQKTVREEFSHCTMLIIAHRLATIIDSDRILVLDAGSCVEFDAPAALLDDTNGTFYDMVQSTGAANARYLQKIARGEVGMKEVLDRPASLRKKTWKKATATARFGATTTGLARKPMFSDNELPDVEEEPEDEANNQTREILKEEKLFGGKSVLESLEAAALDIQAALDGESAAQITKELERTGVPEDAWWKAFLGLIDTISSKAKKVRTRVESKPLTRMGEQSITWSSMSYNANH